MIIGESEGKHGCVRRESRYRLVTEQSRDPELSPLFKLILREERIQKISGGYYLRNDVMM